MPTASSHRAGSSSSAVIDALRAGEGGGATQAWRWSTNTLKHSTGCTDHNPIEASVLVSMGMWPGWLAMSHCSMGVF